MIDERAASWRYFLGLEKFKRVLLVGGDLGLLSGIARAAESLESLSPIDIDVIEDSLSNIAILKDVGNISGKYTLIIIASKDISEHLLKDLSLLFLDELGSVVFLPGFFDASICERLDPSFRVERYAALPPKNPRVFFSLQNDWIRRKGLTFHMPGSLKGVLFVKLLLLISSTKISWSWLFNALVFVHRSSVQGGSETLLNWLNSKLEARLSELVVYAGSNSINRKLTFLAVCDQGKDYVVKLGDTTDGIVAIRKESVALNDLSLSVVSEFIPSVIFEGEFIDGAWVQVQDVSPIRQRKQLKELTELHFSVLAKLATIETKEIFLKDCILWNECVAKMSAINNETIYLLFIKMQQSILAGSTIVTHRVHGDFAPWNIQCDLNDLYIYDWEDSRPDGWVVSDLIHFIYRQAHLVGPWLGAESLFNDINENLSKLTDMTKLRVDIDQVVGLWVIFEFIRLPSEHLEELAKFLVARGNL